MPISSLAQIIIRIFALFWTVFGSISFIALLFSMTTNLDYSVALYPILLRVFFGVLLWFLAPKIARVASKGSDQEVHLNNITEAQLFSTAFVALGLYFALSSFPEVINGIYLLITVEEQLAGSGLEATLSRIYTQNNFTKEMLILPSLSFGIGLVSILSARAWAKKLTR